MDWAAPFAASFRAVYVDRSSGLETGTVDGLLKGGTVSRNQDTDSKESATVTVAGSFSPGARLVRLYADVTQGDEMSTVCLGTFVPTVTGDSFDGAATTWAVDLDGRLSELSADAFDGPVTYPAGTPAVQAAREICEAAGFEVVAEPSTYTLAANRTYGLDEGDSKLSAVNDLLSLAGFASARCDAYGRVVMASYVAPARRGVQATMAEGAGCRFERAASRKRDESEVANVVRCVYETQDATVVGLAVDDSPTSPYSTVARGRRIVSTYRYTDGSTQAAADAKAAALLAGMRTVVTTVEITHAYLPLALGDVVALDYPSAGYSGRFAIRTQEISLSDAMPVAVELRSFAGGD